MNSGIYYLYEYNHNRKLRNVGFLKLSGNSRKLLLQMQIRNISVTRQETADLAVFYLEDETAVFYTAAQIPCGSHAISTQLELAQDSLPEAYRLDRISGFLLILPDDTYLAATMPETALDVGKIRQYHTRQDSPAPAAEDIRLPEKAPLPDRKSEAEPEMKIEADAKTESEIAPEMEPKPEPKIESEMESKTEPEAKSETEAKAQRTGDISATEQSEADSERRTLRKIHPGELSCLPRRYWNLANNSFLMHGCRNYHHLLLIEENGHCWVGVPGVYDPREARAAELFGFPQFNDSFNSRLSLTDDESSPVGKFGYWCRSIY